MKIMNFYKYIKEATDKAYKGYLIRKNPFDEMFYVSKGGSHITIVKTEQEAKKAIDELV
jgi:hypothetical protein